MFKEVGVRRGGNDRVRDFVSEMCGNVGDVSKVGVFEGASVFDGGWELESEVRRVAVGVAERDFNVEAVTKFLLRDFVTTPVSDSDRVMICDSVGSKLTVAVAAVVHHRPPHPL